MHLQHLFNTTKIAPVANKNKNKENMDKRSWKSKLWNVVKIIKLEQD